MAVDRDWEGAFNFLGTWEESKAQRRGTEHPSGQGTCFPTQTCAEARRSPGSPRAAPLCDLDEPCSAATSSSWEEHPPPAPSTGDSRG